MPTSSPTNRLNDEGSGSGGGILLIVAIVGSLSIFIVVLILLIILYRRHTHSERSNITPFNDENETVEMCDNPMHHNIHNNEWQQPNAFFQESSPDNGAIPNVWDETQYEIRGNDDSDIEYENISNWNPSLYAVPNERKSKNHQKSTRSGAENSWDQQEYNIT